MFRNINALIEGCIRREEKAWERFIEQFSGLLYYSAQERLKRSGIAFSLTDIEDIVQVVFLDIWEKEILNKIEKRDSIKAWLSIMAQTRAISYMRKKKERLLRKEELFRVGDIKVEPLKDMMEQLEEKMEGFNARQKIILKWSIVYKKRHREIAGFMRLPVNTVSTIIARGKKALQKRFLKE